jgi:hypothetical protein
MVCAGFTNRKNTFLNKLVALTGGWEDWQIVRGMARLEKQRLAGTRVASELAAANTDIRAGCAAVHGAGYQGDFALMHGGYIMVALCYLKYNSYLTADTIDQAGATNTLKAVGRQYRNRVFNTISADSVNFDIFNFNPWNPVTAGVSYNGTLNHKLAYITGGLLMAEMFYDESYRGKIGKDIWATDNTSSSLSYWHYFRDAWYRWMGPWSNGQANHFASDPLGTEKDGISYAHVHLGFQLLLRDLVEGDIAFTDQIEIMCDRLMLDYAEDSVRNLHTGAKQRAYHQSHITGDPMWPTNYLLFDNLGGEIFGGSGLVNWGRQAHMAVTFCDYNPLHLRFPRAIVEIAREKNNGYMVRENSDRDQANWVENDFALGMYSNGRSQGEDVVGGFWATTPAAMTGAAIIPFTGTGPFGKKRAAKDCRGVFSRRIAITRFYSASVAGGAAHPRQRLYVLNSGANVFSEFDVASDWIIARRSTHRGRDVFVAVRMAGATKATYAGEFDTQPEGTPGSPAIGNDPHVGGTLYQFGGTANNPLVWEISTSQDETWDAFRTRIKAAGNQPVISGTRCTYRSSKTGIALDFDMSSMTATGHRNQGTAVNYGAFDHGTHAGLDSPYEWTNAVNSYRLSIRTGSYSTDMNWNPSGGGVAVREFPNKTNETVGGASGPVNPVTARALFIDGQLKDAFDPAGKAGPTVDWDTTEYAVGSHNLQAMWGLQDGTQIFSPIRRHNISINTDPDAVARNRLKTKVGSLVDPSLRTRYEIVMGRPMQEMGRFAPTAAWGLNGDGTTAPGSFLRYWENLVDECNVRAAAGDMARVWVACPMLTDTSINAGDARTLAYGANGGYNPILTKWGQILAGLTHKRMVGIRLGWEGAGGWFRWGLRNTVNGTPAEAAIQYAAYWRVIHNQVRTATGTGFSEIHWDWNAIGEVGFNLPWRAEWEAAWPGDAYVNVVSIDAYHQIRFVQGWTNSAGANIHVPLRDALQWVSNFAAAHGKKTGFSEGSPFVWKYKSSEVHHQLGLTSGESSSNVAFARDLIDWGLAEAAVDRLSHLLIFERDKYEEGFFMFVTGIGNTSARQQGEERTDPLLKLLHPWEHKRRTSDNFYAFVNPAGDVTYRAAALPVPAGYEVYGIPGAVPRPSSTNGVYGAGGVTDPELVPPDTLGHRANVYTATAGGRPGGPRGTLNGHTPAPFLLTFWLDELGGPVT